MKKDRFDEMVEYFDCERCNDCIKYSSAGEVFFADNEFYTGNYWYYMGDDFIIDIHDFYFNKEYITPLEYKEDSYCLLDYAYIISNYMISANGECFEPYENIGSDTMMIIVANENLNKNQRFSFHAKSKYISVGIKYGKKYIERNFSNEINIEKIDFERIFLDTKKIVTRPISKLSNEILNCKMTDLPAKMFFEAKAKEWLSITLNAYNELKNNKNDLHETDKIAIRSVAKYIDDHYSIDISQSFLESVAMMSGTKLKTTFKKYFNQSITEYTQRRRMNIAENLIASTDLDIASIAKAVGYNSPSRFSTLFKRYKGIYPKDVRVKEKYICKNRDNCRDEKCMRQSFLNWTNYLINTLIGWHDIYFMIK